MLTAGNSDAEAAEEEQNAATLFYDTLMDKAEIGEVAGDTFATFLDVLHLTPRFVPFQLQGFIPLNYSNHNTEDVSIWICTRAPSDCVVRHTTTRFSTTT